MGYRMSHGAGGLQAVQSAAGAERSHSLLIPDKASMHLGNFATIGSWREGFTRLGQEIWQG